MSYLTNKKLYQVWANIKTRCYNSDIKDFKSYGGRGIKICNEWKGTHSFPVFEKWALGNGYKIGLSIERINNNGNYEPKNCKWATKAEQSRNQRRIKLNPEKIKEIFWLRNQCYYTQPELAEIFKVSVGMIQKILYGKKWKGVIE